MKKNKNDPCWKNYIQLGTKKKNGKEVPNCVPMKEALSKDADAGDYIRDFQKSDAPQFNVKSKEKRREMAVAAFMASKENMKEETHSAEKILGSKASQKYKSKNQWISAAKGMGLVVKSPSVDVEGNVNKDFLLMAYDKAGNTKGVWYKKDGVLKEDINEAVSIPWVVIYNYGYGRQEIVKGTNKKIKIMSQKQAEKEAEKLKKASVGFNAPHVHAKPLNSKIWDFVNKRSPAGHAIEDAMYMLQQNEEVILENDMKKVATKLSSSKNPAVKKIVATLNSGKEPSSKDILSLKGSVQDDVIQAFAEVIGPEETMKKFNIKEEESHD
jgi:hypothetical protein